MEIDDLSDQNLEMKIVSANEESRAEGFSKAIKLEDVYVEKIKELLKSEKICNLKEEIRKIINFADYHRLLIDEEDGDKEVLLEIEGKQQVFFADFSGIKDGMITIFFNPTLIKF